MAITITQQFRDEKWDLIVRCECGHTKVIRKADGEKTDNYIACKKGIPCADCPTISL